MVVPGDGGADDDGRKRNAQGFRPQRQEPGGEAQRKRRGGAVVRHAGTHGHARAPQIMRLATKRRAGGKRSRARQTQAPDQLEGPKSLEKARTMPSRTRRRPGVEAAAARVADQAGRGGPVLEQGFGQLPGVAQAEVEPWPETGCSVWAALPIQASRSFDALSAQARRGETVARAGFGETQAAAELILQGGGKGVVVGAMTASALAGGKGKIPPSIPGPGRGPGPSGVKRSQARRPWPGGVTSQTTACCW